MALENYFSLTRVYLHINSGLSFNKKQEDTMEKMKNVQEYINEQRRSIAANPDCGTSHYNLAVALMGIEEFHEAERELHQAIDCSPGLVEAYVQLGGLCLKRGDLDGCLAYNKAAVKARPGFSEGYGNIGFVHMQKGEIEEAVKALEKATAFNFRFIQAYTTLGTAYLMMGRVDDSIAASQKALEIDKNFPVAHNNLSVAYLEKNDFEKAVFHCDRALELGYDVPGGLLKEIAPHRKK